MHTACNNILCGTGPVEHLVEKNINMGIPWKVNLWDEATPTIRPKATKARVSFEERFRIRHFCAGS